MSSHNKQKIDKNKAKTKVTTLNRNNVKIIGENVLYNNGLITAYYIIPMVNYSTASQGGIENSIEDLENMIKNLCTTNPETLFTIERIEKVIRREDVLKNLCETIKIYRPDYDMPEEFTDHVQDDTQEYCLLGIDIQQSSIENIDDYSLMDTAKTIFKQAVNAFAGLGSVNIDPEKILNLETNIYNTIKYKCLRATKDLVFYNYVSKVFPNYEISYDQLSYVNENHFEDIMGAITQTVTDNFGSFEMHNEGVDIFGLEPQTTYGCMLNVKAFPLKINNVNFPMDFGNLTTTIKCLKKENANVKIKRIRASNKYTEEQQIEAGAELEQIEATQTTISIATQALQDIENDAVLCEFSTTILVTAESLPELRSYIRDIMTECKDREILVSKSLTQALDFLNYYVNKKPKKLDHMANIGFPLSFQQNAGATVGDTDGIWSPAIGEDF